MVMQLYKIMMIWLNNGNPNLDLCYKILKRMLTFTYCGNVDEFKREKCLRLVVEGERFFYISVLCYILSTLAYVIVRVFY